MARGKGQGQGARGKGKGQWVGGKGQGAGRRGCDYEGNGDAHDMQSSEQRNR